MTSIEEKIIAQNLEQERLGLILHEKDKEVRLGKLKLKEIKNISARKEKDPVENKLISNSVINSFRKRNILHL